MAHLIQKDNSNNVIVIYTGSVDLNERKLAVDEACELANPPDPVRLLIDVRKIIMNMSLDEQEDFVGYLVEKKELVNAKVAILHNPQSNPNLMINTFAYIAGYQTVDFDRENDAISWLNGNFK